MPHAFMAIGERLKIKIPVKYLGLAGIIASGFGALITAISVGGYYGGGIESLVSGLHYELAYINVFVFRIGLTLLILGFLAQYFERTKQDFGGMTIYDVLIRIVLYGAFMYLFFIFVSDRLLFI